MQAVICTKYGPPDVLQLKEIETPEPKANEVLIKVRATTAHIGDTKIRRGRPFLARLVFGLFQPKKNLILGFEISGEIVSTGTRVNTFKTGDQIFALTGFNLGGYAEYLCLPAIAKPGTLQKKGLLMLKPENLSWEEAAAVPAGGLTALKNLQKVPHLKGKSVLINGASGSLGTYAVQLSKYYGAEVIAVCSKNNFELVKSIGADKLIDYTTANFAKSNETYDVVYDAVMKLGKKRGKRLLKRNGHFLNNSHLPAIQKNDLQLLKVLIEKQKIKPVIDRLYTIEDIIDAHYYVEQGHKKGNVVISMSPFSRISDSPYLYPII